MNTFWIYGNGNGHTICSYYHQMQSRPPLRVFYCLTNLSKISVGINYIDTQQHTNDSRHRFFQNASASSGGQDPGEHKFVFKQNYFPNLFTEVLVQMIELYCKTRLTNGRTWDENGLAKKGFSFSLRLCIYTTISKKASKTHRPEDTV